MRKSFEDILEGKHDRRLKAEERLHDRIVKREEKAERMIGELVRDGRTVNYIFPVGGRYREGSRVSLIAFLIRNQYA